MNKHAKVASAIGLTFLAFLGGLLAVPFLAIAAGGGSPHCGAAGTVEVDDDGTPSLLGPSTLTVTDLRAWWDAQGRGQPSRLQVDISDLIAVYLSEGNAEGVRGDMAFAQAIAETGYFTNTDTSINNFAGIAHYDSAASGTGFSSPIIGVRAHIQLLKKFTTAEMLDVQNRIAARFRAGRHEATHLVADHHLTTALDHHRHLTDEQSDLVRSWCQGGHRFQAAIGRAGTGKTTTVAACAEAWQAAGYRVLGAAVKGEAARTLATATGIECETVAWYIAHTDPEHPPLDSRTILVIDEASTLHDRALDTLMTMATDTGASLRLVGDPAQHGAIAAGGMFRVLCERHPGLTPELTTTHRLQHPQDRAAAEVNRTGFVGGSRPLR